MKLDIPRIKVCCIKNKTEAIAAMKLGVDAIGLSYDTDGSHYSVPPDKIREITRAIPPSIDAFILTRSTNSWDLIDLVRKVKNRTVQLVDRLGLGNYLEIRSSIPCVKIVQTIKLTGDEAFETAIKVDPFVDLIILESEEPESLSSGQTENESSMDWELCKRIIENLDTPVIIAGGLNPGNVAEIVHYTKPFGVDVCKGVRTNDELDISKLGRFIRNAKGY